MINENGWNTEWMAEAALTQPDGEAEWMIRAGAGLLALACMDEETVVENAPRVLSAIRGLASRMPTATLAGASMALFTEIQKGNL